MTAITPNLPDETVTTAQGLTAERRVPAKAVFVEAIEWMAESERQWADFDARGRRARPDDIAAIMAKVPAVSPVPGDGLD